MNLMVDFLGIKLLNPFILGSGPLSYSAKGIIRAHKAGFGAVVTKTIRDNPADNPMPHIALAERNTMINAEEWSDLPGEMWVEKEIPAAKKAGTVIIASIGHTLAEVENWLPGCDAAGADAFELVSYTEDTIRMMIKKARELTEKPVLVKISPNWSDPVKTAMDTIKLGADGITVMDSIGPVLRIDIKTGKPLVDGAGGRGWLTGSAIKPIALHYVAEISSLTDKPVMGLGGVTTAEDAVEMLMAGARVVGLCTAPIIRGVEYIEILKRKFQKLTDKLGFDNIDLISGYSGKFLSKEPNMKKYDFAYNADTCTMCMACVKACSYEARMLNNKIMTLDTEACRYCGLCYSVCANGSLRREDV